MIFFNATYYETLLSKFRITTWNSIKHQDIEL
jgi:hypothetical protein